MSWLLLYALSLVAVAIMARRVRHLSLLAGGFALNALAFLALPVGTGHYMAAGLADLVMALLCVRLWCFASRRVAQLALIGMCINFAMHGWYQTPVPYEWFMMAYGWYPNTIRGIELGQLLVLFYWTPSAQRLVRRFASNPEKKGETPCLLIAHH